MWEWLNATKEWANWEVVALFFIVGVFFLQHAASITHRRALDLKLKLLDETLPGRVQMIVSDMHKRGRI